VEEERDLPWNARACHRFTGEREGREIRETSGGKGTSGFAMIRVWGGGVV